MAITFDGDWTSEQPTGNPVLQHELAETPQATGFLQPFMCPVSVYSPPTLGATTSFLGVTWYFVKDQTFRDHGAGIWSYEREYVRQPDPITTYESWSGTFPGLIFRRDPIPLTVTSEVVIEFFVGDPESIPEIQADLVTAPLGEFAPLFSPIYLSAATTPSKETWISAIAAATAFAWKPEASQLRLFKGNIWQRSIRRVTAR